MVGVRLRQANQGRRNKDVLRPRMPNYGYIALLTVPFPIVIRLYKTATALRSQRHVGKDMEQVFDGACRRSRARGAVNGSRPLFASRITTFYTDCFDSTAQISEKLLYHWSDVQCDAKVDRRWKLHPLGKATNF